MLLGLALPWRDPPGEESASRSSELFSQGPQRSLLGGVEPTKGTASRHRLGNAAVTPRRVIARLTFWRGKSLQRTGGGAINGLKAMVT